MIKLCVLILGCLAAFDAVKGDSAWSASKNWYEGLIKIGSFELKECLIECLYMEYCNIAGFDYSNNNCFIQMESEIKPVPRDENSTFKTYEINKRDYHKGELCWKKVPGKKIKGLTSIIAFDSVVACMSYCIGCRICQHITFDTESTPNCWLQLAKGASVLDEESFVSSTSANSYILDKACLVDIQSLPN